MDNQEELNEIRGEGLSEDDVEALKSGKTQRPNFPFLVFSAAIVKDVADMASLGTVGIIISIITTPIIFFYTLGKMGFIKKKLWKKFTLTAAAELLPWVSFIPASSLFVLSAHATEYKQIDRVLNIIEKASL